MNYMEGERSISHFESIFSGRGVEFTAFKQIIFELLVNIEGEEADKLRQLLQLDPVYRYHCDLLDSFLFQNRVTAYNYFNYIQLGDDDVIKKIMKDLQSNVQLIAFSAASAMMACTNAFYRGRALEAIVRREEISRMAILEMLYNFHYEDAEALDEEAEILKRLITKTHYPAKNIGILIQGISEIGYHQLPPLLNKKLYSNTSRWNHPEILSALIEAMGNFYYEEASPGIRRYIYHESQIVRRACVNALAKLPTPENLKALYNMLFDSEIEIKFRAVEALINSGKKGKSWLRRAAKIDRDRPFSALLIQPILERINPDYGILAG